MPNVRLTWLIRYGEREDPDLKGEIAYVSALQWYTRSSKDPYVQCSIIGLDGAKIDATRDIRQALNEPVSTLTLATRLNRDLLP